MYVLLNFTQASLWSLLTPLVFIGSIYIKKPSAALRNHPEEIKRRFLVVGSATFLWTFLFYYLNSHPHLSAQGPGLLTWIGISFTFTNYISVLCSLAMTFVLYAGSLAQVLFQDPPDIELDIKAMRAYVMAPIFEETMYRSTMITCLICGGYGWDSVWVSALIFGLSHLYRIEDVVQSGLQISIPNIMPVVFQVVYTGLFGLYVGYVFVVTGSLWAVVVLHGFCNFMGLPNLRFLEPNSPAYRYRNWVAFTYLAGICGFFTLLYLMMNPEFFNSWHSEFIKRLS